MKIVFVTVGNPFAEYGGLAIYSKQALGSLSNTFFDCVIDVICLIERTEKDSQCPFVERERRDNLNLYLVYVPPRSRIVKGMSVFLPVSYNSIRFNTSYIKDLIVSLGDRDLVIFNHRLTLSLSNIYKNNEVKRVYISHNDELGSVKSIANYFSSKLLGRLVVNEAEKIFREELCFMRLADQVCFISESDRAAYCEDELLSVRSKFSVIPPYFGSVNKSDTDTEKLNSLLLVGSFDWLPKKRNAEWLIDKVFPLIKAQFEDAELLVVGRAADHLDCDNSLNVKLVSNVESVTEYYQNATVFLIPEGQSGGVKLKSIEASAHGLPIVSTPEGVSGAGLLNGVSCLVVEYGNASKFADAVCQLLRSRTLRDRLGREAKAVFAENYTFTVVDQKWLEFWGSIRSS